VGRSSILVVTFGITDISRNSGFSGLCAHESLHLILSALTITYKDDSCWLGAPNFGLGQETSRIRSLAFYLEVYSRLGVSIVVKHVSIYTVRVFTEPVQPFSSPYLASELWSNKFQREHRCVEHKQTVSLPLTRFICLYSDALLYNDSTQARLHWSLWLSQRRARVYHLVSHQQTSRSTGHECTAWPCVIMTN
jgi:hypothetical protein